MPQFILAIDQGTTGSTVALMDERGRVRASVNYEFPQIYPRPGWVEHRPQDIWTSVGKALRAIFRKKLCKPADIAAIGITNQRETALSGPSVERSAAPASVQLYASQRVAQG